MCLSVALSSGTPYPTGSAHAAGTCATTKNMSNHQIFGVPEAKATAASQPVHKLHIAVGMVVLTAAWCAALLAVRVLIF